jgi:hypothetical protein
MSARFACEQRSKSRVQVQAGSKSRLATNAAPVHYGPSFWLFGTSTQKGEITMRMAISAAVFFACSSTFAAADQLPVQDGRYARADVPCDTAPMSVRAVIVHGSPMFSPQYGECKTQITKRTKDVYVVSADCTGGGRDDPPVTTYNILSRTKFLWQNRNGKSLMRWCSGL